jgi:hypothetical protein
VAHPTELEATVMPGCWPEERKLPLRKPKPAKEPKVVPVWASWFVGAKGRVEGFVVNVEKRAEYPTCPHETSPG